MPIKVVGPLRSSNTSARSYLRHLIGAALRGSKLAGLVVALVAVLPDISISQSIVEPRVQESLIGFGAGDDTASRLAAFPPRNEPLQFRQSLESYYQNTLRRTPIGTAVDLEGSVVWTQEYLRYRLSGCDHADSATKVLSQIDGRSAPTECGGSVGFPPRNEALNFRANYLEAKYRDGLRRPFTSTYVDFEGDIVWMMEYFRYRLSGCSHDDASQKTFTQVAGGAAPATCQTMLAIWTSASQGWSSIAVTIGGRSVGTLTRFLEPGTATSCAAVDGARVVAVVQPGVVTFSARSDRGVTWSDSRTLTNGECRTVELTCTNRNCGSTTAAPPTTTPTVPPVTAPPSTGTYHVWGGATYSQYLGYFSCLFCTEFGSDSINNQFGTYGSRFSSTSMRNRFGQYGSQFSSVSACNQFAGNPPRVFNSNRTVYYGELTLNQFRSDAIRLTNYVSWLRNDVCND